MSDRKRCSNSSPARRQFLALLGGTAAAAWLMPLSSARRRPKEQDLREADFYRPHDLAG